MIKAILMTLAAVASTVAPLRADSAKIELQHLSAAEFMEVWLRGAQGNAAPQKGEAADVAVVGDVTARGLRRENAVEIEGAAEAIRKARALAAELDVAPLKVKLRVIRLQVPHAEGKSAPDALGIQNVMEFNKAQGDKHARLLELAAQNRQVRIETDVEAACLNNRRAVFTFTAGEGRASTTTVTPMIRSDGQCTLDIRTVNLMKGASSELTTTATGAMGDLIWIGGPVRTDEAGGKFEETVIVIAESEK